MKVYKITLCFIDFDEIEDDEEIMDLIEGARLPNHIAIGDVMEMQSVDIGEWKDNNPLNNRNTSKDEFNRLFPK